ncbi:MAG: hypothetical protein IKJ01_03395 [Lachnospiraceae bacterium]|nr:hypothetical protein [Lachnospiraceae bacterium]
MKKEFKNCILNDRKFNTHIDIIGKASEGWSQPDVVKIKYEGKELIGYRKSTIILGEKNVIEIVLGKIGIALGVSMADTVCVFSDNTYKNLTDIISISVVRGTHEYFINFREMRDELFYDLQKGNISITPWITRWMTIRKRKNELLKDIWDIKAVNDSDYYDSIQFAFEVGRLYIDKYKLKMHNFQSAYIKMIMFDILTGQADRTPSNYGLLINNNLSTASLAPLFDNSTLTKPYMEKDEINLNHIILKKERVTQVLYDMYPNEFLNIKKQILEKSNELKGIIESESYLSKENKKLMLNTIEEGLAIFERVG